MRAGGPLLLAAVLSACGGSRPPAESAREVSGTLLSAMAVGDAATLARLTGRTEEETRALLDDARAELGAEAAAAAERPVESRGRAYLESGAVVAMVHEDGGWRVASGILGVPGLESPTDAIRALHVMLGRVEATGVETVLSRETRLVFHEELERWWRATADPDALPIAVDGDTAVATTPWGGTIELRREAGDWRVVDLR